MKHAFVAILILGLSACSKKRVNQDLYKESTASSLSFYKGKDTLYPPKGGSPHGSFRIRLNEIAASSPNVTSGSQAGQNFEKGALIVKEAYKNGALELYAVMKKDPSSKLAAGGWIWAEYGPDGKTIYNASKKGDACLPCHSTGAHRDLTQTFGLH